MWHPKIAKIIDEHLTKGYRAEMQKMAAEYGRPLTPHEMKIVRRVFFQGANYHEAIIRALYKRARMLF